MQIIKRGYSAKDERMIRLLQGYARKIAIYLSIRKISVPGDKIYVWIKDVNDELYPKIDIDSGRGFELTYEFDPKSFKILPPRFAKFVKNPSTNRFQRVKIEKNELPPDLQTLHNHVMKALTS